VKILAVDTSTQNCGVCIMKDGDVLVEISLNNGRTHSIHLMKMIMDALDYAGWGPGEIDGYAVVVGPGSFTGLRIGIASIKGLASAGNKKVAGVSSLDALAFQCRAASKIICCILDARKQEVYTSRYRIKDGMPVKIQGDRVICLEQAIGDIDEPCWFVGDGAVLYRRMILDQMGAKAFFPLDHDHRIRASSAAWIGQMKFERNESDSPEFILPNYIRSSDAKIKK
jgi:tRNA threonylcarbamoyladenosine biosynthesis protein TsaB